MNLIDLIVGKPLKTSDERAEQIGPAAGIPIFGLDALSSAAYGPEAALTLLIPLGLLGVRYIVPISMAIITLLMIVYLFLPANNCSVPIRRRIVHRGAFQPRRFSQPARGRRATDGLHSYSSCGNLRWSWRPGFGGCRFLQPHTVSICVGILIVITILNLRGVHDTGIAFMIPTYLFRRHTTHPDCGRSDSSAGERRASGPRHAASRAGTRRPRP